MPAPDVSTKLIQAYSSGVPGRVSSTILEKSNTLPLLTPNKTVTLKLKKTTWLGTLRMFLVPVQTSSAQKYFMF